MQSSLQTPPSQNGPSDQVEIASISEPRGADGELVTRARSILRWKIRYTPSTSRLGTATSFSQDTCSRISTGKQPSRPSAK